METILIVEDDAAMMRGLKDNFEMKGYEVICARDGEAGLNAALDEKPDLILLDIMLPKINGYEICRLVRQEKLDMPIIMLTAKGQESDIVLGLNLGADDYVTKPFSIRELMARAEAFLRRRRTEEPEVFEFPDWQLDVRRRRLVRDGAEVKLARMEFEVLAFFCRRPWRAMTREEILRRVWGYSSIVSGRVVDRAVVKLRKQIEPDPRTPVYIRTIRGIGYKFEPPEETED